MCIHFQSPANSTHDAERIGIFRQLYLQLYTNYIAAITHFRRVKDLQKTFPKNYSLTAKIKPVNAEFITS